jgi:hypothetical protein
MIQRIQTFYLIAAIICLFVNTIVPMAYFTDHANNTFRLMHNGLQELVSGKIIQVYYNLSITILLSVAIAMTVYIIINYKRRALQMFSIKILWVAIFASQGSVLWIYFMTKPQFVGSNLSFTAFLPVLAMILSFLAFRNIKKDDDLVKSIDRLR